ncbi:unnamed protein product [Paramecium sonneborni]|uniref:Uncharacterized protein n=1 Tax=Paramecium sonneborni TaxID=65129 RepID=A0A8S1RU35_9CILI|nr:unnamed protein product [Paramecium sonneborni]
MAELMEKTKFLLRGGGCITSNQIRSQQQITNTTKKEEDQEIDIFISRFNFYVKQIFTKAAVAMNEQESQDIMIAIQWFIFQEENIYKLNKNAGKVMKSYDLILDGIRKLLKSCLIYIRTDQFKQIYEMLFKKGISGYYGGIKIINGNRVQIQMEIFLFLTRTSFEIAPNNRAEQEEIVKGCLNGIITSITQMKPSAKLLESLFQGVCLLYKMYSVQNNRKLYEVYFQIDMLQWEIISYFQNSIQKNLDEILFQIQEIHKNLVLNSNNWVYHFLWIQLIGKILIYNPLLTKPKLNDLVSRYNFGANSRQIWKEFQNKGLIIQMNHSKDQSVIQLHQFKNKQLLQIDSIILEDSFKGWEPFILLKDFLQNEQNTHFTFRSYVQNKLKVINIEPQKNENIIVIGQIQQFFDFIISNKLLNVIKERYEKLAVVNETSRNLMENNTKFNERILQAVQNQQINRMILNLKDYIQKTQIIFKLIGLYYRKQNFQQFKQEKIFEFNNLQQLKYLMKVLESILQSQIKGFKDKSNHQQSQLETDERVLIQNELKNLKLKNLWLDNLKNQFSDLLAAVSPDQKNFFKVASTLIQLITNSQKQLEKIEITQLQENNNIIEFFQNQLNNLQKEYEDMNQELINENNKIKLFIKQIFQIKQEIDAFQKPENLKEIQGLTNYIQNLRFRYLKLYLKLETTKKTFQTILGQTSPEELQTLQEFINLDKFLFKLLCFQLFKIIKKENEIKFILENKQYSIF